MAIFNRNNMLSDYAFEDMGGDGLFDTGSFNLQDLMNYAAPLDQQSIGAMMPTPEPVYSAPEPVYQPIYQPTPVYIPPVYQEPIYQPAYQPEPVYTPEPVYYAPQPTIEEIISQLPPSMGNGLLSQAPIQEAFVQDSAPTVEPTPTVAPQQLTQQPPVEEPKASQQDIIDSLTKQILGSSDTSKWQGGVGAETAAKDMAKIMAGIGITDISQFGKVTQTGLQEDVRPDGRGGFVNLKGQPVDPAGVIPLEMDGNIVGYSSPTGTQETYGNKATGQSVPLTYSERQTGNAFGGTFEGKGNTGYRVEFDASGKPVFYTTGASSSDAASATPFIQMALLATGAGGLLGNALLGSGASQVAANALGGAILGGGTAAITGADIVKGALMGGAGGALSGYLAPELPTDLTGTPTIDPEAFMTPDVSIFDTPIANTLFPPIEAPPIDVQLPTIAPELPYIAPESFMTPELPYVAPELPYVAPPQPTYIEPEAFMTPAPQPTYVAPPVVPEPMAIPEPVVIPEPVYTPPQPTYVEPESFMTPDISYFEAPPTDTFLPAIEAPPIDVTLPTITEAPVVTAPTYVEPEAFMTPQAPVVADTPIVAEAPVIPEIVITPQPTYVEPEAFMTPMELPYIAPPAPIDLGIDYSLANGTTTRPLTDMGGAQGVQPGTSANLPDMGGGQGLTINLGAPSTTLADALATFGGVNPANMPSMGGAQGLTYQTPTGLVTEGGLLATGIAGTAPSVLGETGINTATNIGSNIGVTPPVSTNPLDKLSPTQIANILKSAVGLFGAVTAPQMLSSGSPSMMGALPTQGVPLNSQDYFNAIQQNYNTLLPAMPRDVSTPLANWYNSQYGA